MKFITVHKDKFALLAILIVAAVLYGATLKGLPGNPVPADFKGNLDDNAMPFELSPERGRFAEVMALGNNGTYILTPELRDVAYPDVGYIGDRYYAYFAPGLPFLATPAYLLGYDYGYSQVSTFAFVAFVSILTMLFLYKIGRNILKMPVWASLLGVFIFAFGSTSWSYAVTLYQHHITTFFLISSFYAAWKFRGNGRMSWMWGVFAALMIAIGLAVDYPNALLLSPVLIYLALSALPGKVEEQKLKLTFRGSILPAFLVFAAVTAGHLYFNEVNFGGWSRLAGTLDSYKKVVEAQLTDPSLTPDEIAAQSIDKTVTGFFSESKLPRGLGVLLFGQERGLFVYAPIFLLSIFGFAMALKRMKSAEIWVMLGSVLVIVFLYSSWGDPWGGWAYGPRYLIPAMASLSLFAAYFAANSARVFLVRTLTAILFMYSSAVALLGVLTTSAIPPKVEAVFLGTDWTYKRNLDFLLDSHGSSFLYNTYLRDYGTLAEYFLVLYALLLTILFSLILAGSRKKDAV